MLDRTGFSSEIGKAALTMRQRQIAQLVSAGLSNKAIGARLGLREGTVKIHMNNIFKRLGIANRTSLAVHSIKLHREQMASLGVDTQGL